MAHSLLDNALVIWTVWDRKCDRTIRAGFARLGFTELLGPPAAAVADLPFIATPTPLVTLTLLYLAIVVSSRLFSAPKNAKKTEETMWLKLCVQTHNLLLIGLSSYMTFTVTREALRKGYSLFGNEYDPRDDQMARYIYTFFASKVYEYLDTIIMVVKGNMRQVSFLHVYHHATIAIIWWAITYVAPGGDAYYSAALNSLVHVVMYVYYFLAAAIGKDEKRRRKWLWWGRYLTMFQMTQFCTMLLQAAYDIYNDAYNGFLVRLLFVYMLTLLALFGHFFIQKYGSTGGNSKANGKSNGAKRRVKAKAV